MKRDSRMIYGETRSLLQGSPSEELFALVCEQVATAWEIDPTQAMAEFIPFIDNALRSWPAHYRTCPTFWEDHFRTKTHYEAYYPLRLIRRIVLGTGWNSSRIRAFGNSTLAPCIEHLTLEHQTHFANQLDHLVQTEHFTRLHTLEFRNTRRAYEATEWLEKLVEWPATRKIELLKLHHYDLRYEEEPLVAFGDAFSELRELWLMECALHGDLLCELLGSPQMTHFNELDLGRCHMIDGLSINLRSGRLIIRDAGENQMRALLDSGWIAHITELKLERCHLQGDLLEAQFDVFLARAHKLDTLTIHRSHVSSRFAEVIVAHKRETLRALNMKKVNYQRGAREILSAAAWTQPGVGRLE